MFEAAAFTYTLLASFVLASAERNRREARPHGRHLQFIGRMLMALSLTSALLFGGYATWTHLIA